MKPFTKLFSSILSSSIWNESNHVRIVWITLLAMCDKDGHVFASVGGLAHQARISLDECRKAITVLEAPDQDSRSKELGGRRIVPIDGGWQVLNYQKYRELGRSEERREYFAERKRIQRASGPQMSRTVQDSPRQVLDPSASASASLSASLASGPSKSKRQSLKALKKGVQGERKDLVARFEAALNGQWVNDAGKWVNRIRDNPGKSERVIAEVELAASESRITSTPAQYAEQIWKEFA